jgi:hypothetical protein
MLMLMVMAALLRASYEMARPGATHTEEVSALADTRPDIETSKHAMITPQQRKWADKAVKKYAQAQEKKWRNWNEAMYEPTRSLRVQEDMHNLKRQ